ERPRKRKRAASLGDDAVLLKTEKRKLRKEMSKKVKQEVKKEKTSPTMTSASMPPPRRLSGSPLDMADDDDDSSDEDDFPQLDFDPNPTELFPPDWKFSKTKPRLRIGAKLDPADVYQWSLLIS